MSSERTCPDCEGWGSVPARRGDHEVRCLACNGRGKRWPDGAQACAACGVPATRWVCVDPGLSEPICDDEDCVQARV